jgi:hypothetical protein
MSPFFAEHETRLLLTFTNQALRRIARTRAKYPERWMEATARRQATLKGIKKQLEAHLHRMMRRRDAREVRPPTALDAAPPP